MFETQEREREPVVDYSESINCIVADFLAFFKTMYSGKHWRSRINKDALYSL